jgi:3-dehydroquinate synthetase
MCGMRMARIKVDLLPNDSDRSYEILIRDGILGETPNRIQSPEDTSSIFVVTDSNVAKL